MHTYLTSIFWSIDSCQNRVPADQYHLTVSRAQVSTHRGQVFFEVIRWQVTSFQLIAGSSLIFCFNSYEICCVYVPHNKTFDFKLTSDAKIQSAATGREDSCFWLFHHVHALVTLYVQFLCSDWSKFDRWVHAENLCSILKVVYFDS